MQKTERGWNNVLDGMFIQQGKIRKGIQKHNSHPIWPNQNQNTAEELILQIYSSLDTHFGVYTLPNDS